MQSSLVLGNGALRKSNTVLNVGSAASNGVGSAGGSANPAGTVAASVGTGTGCIDAGADM